MRRFASSSTRAQRVAYALALLLASTPAFAQGSATGSITGTVTTAAKAPRPIRVTTDMRVCGTSVPDEAIVVGPAGELANVVVTLTGVKAAAAAEVPVVNEKCRFAPRVQVVRPKAVVKASSKDAILHTTNAQFEGGAPLFNIGLPAPNLTVAKPIGGPGLVRLSCNSHTWMRGWLVVTDEAAAVTGPDGRFTLPNVAPGTYELRIWHESLKAAPQKVTVTAGKATAVKIAM